MVKQIKINHRNASTVLNPGTILGPGARVAGVDIYAELERDCNKPKPNQMFALYACSSCRFRQFALLCFRAQRIGIPWPKLSTMICIGIIEDVFRARIVLQQVSILERVRSDLRIGEVNCHDI